MNNVNIMREWVDGDGDVMYQVATEDISRITRSKQDIYKMLSEQGKYCWQVIVLP